MGEWDGKLVVGDMVPVLLIQLSASNYSRMRSILACSNASTCIEQEAIAIETECEELVGASNDSGIENILRRFENLFRRKNGYCTKDANRDKNCPAELLY